MGTARAARKRAVEDDRPIAPVTIFDASGRVVRVVSAKEFQRAVAERQDNARALERGASLAGAPTGPAATE